MSLYKMYVLQRIIGQIKPWQTEVKFLVRISLSLIFGEDDMQWNTTRMQRRLTQ
jgi:hypothetical protein